MLTVLAHAASAQCSFVRDAATPRGENGLATQQLAPCPKSPLPKERIPFRAARGLDLAQEQRDTLQAQRLNLPKDPHAKPSGMEVDLDHLSNCTACVNRARARSAVHAVKVLRPGSRWQLFADDFAVNRWNNIVRFVGPPHKSMQTHRPSDLMPEAGADADKPPMDEAARQAMVPQEFRRTGCPCSVVRAPSGETMLWHLLPPLKPQCSASLFGDVNADITYGLTRSADGVGGWSRARRVKFGDREDIDHNIKSFIVTPSTHRRGAAPGFVAGFQGDGPEKGEACLATSADGLSWHTLGSHGDRVEGYDGFKLRLWSRLSPLVRCSRWWQRLPSWLPGMGLIRWLASREQMQQRRIEHRVACGVSTRAPLGRAADTYVQALPPRRVLYRRDFGTRDGWREIRGLQVVDMPLGFDQLPDSPEPSTPHVLASWYFDALGKPEKLRRQLYALSLTPYGDLWLGLLTVIEWPKQPRGDLGGDTTNIYLVTSRDGVHIEDDWVYAQQPLVPKGTNRADWNAGFVLHAAQIVTDASEHRVYFEARQGSPRGWNHDDRWFLPPSIGVASWPLHRMVGLRAADPSAPASLTTKPVKLAPPRLTRTLLLNAELPTPRSSLLVEMLDEHGAALPGCSGPRGGATIRPSDSALCIVARFAGQCSTNSTRALRLRFTLTDDARLHAFRFVPSHVAAPCAAPDADSHKQG